MKKSIRIKSGISALLLAAVLSGCGLMGNTEKTEATAAQIEAAQMMGREAAKDFVGREFNDSMELHNALLNVAATRSKYIMENRREECAAFDSVFISTLETIRPGLAREISRMRQNDESLN